MAYLKANEQTIRINVLDAESKNLIQKDFSIYLGERQGGFSYHQSLQGGTGLVTQSYITASATVTYSLSAEQVAAFGYDINSLTGNVISAGTDESGMPYLPWVVNFYLRKI